MVRGLKEKLPSDHFKHVDPELSREERKSFRAILTNDRVLPSYLAVRVRAASVAPVGHCQADTVTISCFILTSGHQLLSPNRKATETGITGNRRSALRQCCSGRFTRTVCPDLTAAPTTLQRGKGSAESSRIKTAWAWQVRGARLWALQNLGFSITPASLRFHLVLLCLNKLTRTRSPQ